MSDLIERLEAATKAGRNLDADIWREVIMPLDRDYRVYDGKLMIDVSHGLGEHRDWRHPGPYDQAVSPPSFTSSLDDAAWMCGKLGWFWRVEALTPTAAIGAKFWATAGPPGEQEQATHNATAALALCLAVLRTREADISSGSSVDAN